MAHPVGMGRGHAFIVVTDTVTGEKFIARAGPSAGSNVMSPSGYLNSPTNTREAGSGKIDAWTGMYSEALEIEFESQFVTIQTVGVFAEGGKTMIDIIEEFVGRFDAQSHEYRLHTSNSNTFVSEALENVFRTDIVDSPEPPLPGAGTDLRNPPRRAQLGVQHLDR